MIYGTAGNVKTKKMIKRVMRVGDEEMMHYIRRQQAKKLAAGATQEELDELLKFPEPIPPATPSSPTGEFYTFMQYLLVLIDFS